MSLRNPSIVDRGQKVTLDIVGLADHGVCSSCVTFYPAAVKLFLTDMGVGLCLTNACNSTVRKFGLSNVSGCGIRVVRVHHDIPSGVSFVWTATSGEDLKDELFERHIVFGIKGVHG